VGRHRRGAVEAIEMVAPTPVMRIQRSGVVELTNIIDVLSEIGNKWGHNEMLPHGNTSQTRTGKEVTNDFEEKEEQELT
jgi:hypothetical protein